MAEEDAALAIQINAGPQADEHELAELMFQLRTELLELDVTAVDRENAGTAPADAKGAGLLAVGGLIVRLALSPDVLKSVVSNVRSWVSRQRVSSVKLTLDGDSCEVTGLPSAEMERLIDLWITRHAGQG